MAPGRADDARRRGVRRAERRGFSLLELLVVLAVATVLIGLLMPSFSILRESARRAGCASNMHQIAIAMESFSRDHHDRLPNSYYSGDRNREPLPQAMMILNRGVRGDTWDGIGRLYAKNYLSGPSAYYCPSHRGEHKFERYEDQWGPRSEYRIFGNYQYRGMLNLASQLPDPVDRYDRDQIRNTHPAGVSLLADGLRTKSDFNHIRGCNLLEDDLSIRWYADTDGRIYNILPDTVWDPWPRNQIWLRLDQGSSGE